MTKTALESDDSEPEAENEGTASTKILLRMPIGLAEKVKHEADEADMLPTEWVRSILRDYFEGDLSYDEEEGADEEEA